MRVAPNVSRAFEKFGYLVLLVMLALEVFRISKPDSKRANRAIAFYNILYGFVVVTAVYAKRTSSTDIHTGRNEN